MDHSSKILKLNVLKNISVSSSKYIFSLLLKKVQNEDSIPVFIRKNTCTDLNSYVINLERSSDKDVFLQYASGLNLEKDDFSIDNTRLLSVIPAFDIINIRFQKFLLEVHSKSSNDGVRGELGTFPTQ